MRVSSLQWRVSGISGILFVILSFIASGINKMPPGYNVDSSTIISWFAEHGQLYRFGHLLAGLAFLLFYFPFYAGLCERLKIAEGNPAIWSRVTWAGAIMSPAAGTVAGAFIMGLAIHQVKGVDALPQYGLAANFYAYTIAGAYAGIAMIGAGLIILKTSVFKRWIGWAGIITGITAITSTIAIIENNPHGIFAILNGIAWLAYFAWLAVLSIEMIRSC